MSSQLILQESRPVIDQPGCGLVQDFGSRRAREVREAVKSGRLVLTITNGIQAWYDEVAGHFLATPDFSLTSNATANFTLTTSANWTVAASALTPAGAAVNFLTHKSDADWTVQDLTAPTVGQGRYLSFVTYASDANRAGEGTGGVITLTCGGVWQVEFMDNGTAILSRREIVKALPDPPYAEFDTKPVTQFDWMTSEAFAQQPFTPHWLWIYEAGSKLVIRNLSPSLEGKLAGLVYDDPSPVIEATSPDEDGVELKHALRSAKWKIEGSGRIALNLSPQKFRAGTCIVASDVFGTSVGPDGSTQKCDLEWYGYGMQSGGTALGVTMTATNEDGEPWPEGTGAIGGDARYKAIAWQAQWTATTTATAFVTGVSVVVPRVTRSDGNVGTDVLALPNVADTRIDLQREGDLTRDRLDAVLTCYKTNLAAYVQPNMAVRYVVDGVTRFRGLTNGAEWRTIADTSTPTGLLSLQAEGLWKRFRHALWPGGAPFDGRKLTECLAEVLEAAGLTSSDYSLAAWDYEFPSAPEGEPPALVYRPGTVIDRILEDLSTKFYGTSYRHYFRMTDGLFVLAAVSQGASAASFYQTTAAALAAGAPYQTIRDGTYSETFDESELYNIVTVIGQKPDGTPLVARCADWNSIRDATAVNYVGEPWQLIVADPGLQTQAAVNWACRSLYELHRRPKVHASWQSLRVDLFPGDVVTLVGANYGDSYVLRAVELAQGNSGNEADPAGLATYQAEKVL